MPSIFCYADPRKRYSVAACAAFAEGCGGEVVTDFRVREGIAVINGMTPVHHALMRAMPGWYQMDHGYFGRGAYFRVTRGSLWTDGRGAPRHDRLAAFDLTFRRNAPRARADIVLAAQSDANYLMFRTDSLQWMSKTVREIRRHSKREVLIRQKPIGRYRNEPPLSVVLPGMWALVCHSSGSALEALAMGLPVVVTEPRYPAALLGTRFEDIERPRIPTEEEVRDLFARLAGQQWTTDEMRSGLCWRELNDGAR